MEQADRSALTIKNYQSDLDAFAAWFENANDEPMTPDNVTPTDLRQYQRFLFERRRLKPSSISRKLATLKSFLAWFVHVGLNVDQRALAPERSWASLKREPEMRIGPRWLDQHEQDSLLRAVERAGKPRDPPSFSSCSTPGCAFRSYAA